MGLFVLGEKFIFERFTEHMEVQTNGDQRFFYHSRQEMEKDRAHKPMEV